MTKILKFNNAILNLDNLDVIQKFGEYYENGKCYENIYNYDLYFTTCLVRVVLTEEEFQYLTEFLKSDFKFHEINKDINSLFDNNESIHNMI
ncbi:hypothetical protein R4K54_09875 [Brachyspira murdochii]|uniref:Uncharacterized protein n=1 Tax=Brachyspira murdochii (strain ATCC 51284 / DSM 12563 / 56-150) TaxID=526224 RepID=D5U792_BRAM5|nr:hypothetical protein [Brachyspira murdochii]ADG70680.1 hypothetical protein Bmur_0579 [Brachyspira murdochii DSM 12563]